MQFCMGGYDEVHQQTFGAAARRSTPSLRVSCEANSRLPPDGLIQGKVNCNSLLGKKLVYKALAGGRVCEQFGIHWSTNYQSALSVRVC